MLFSQCVGLSSVVSEWLEDEQAQPRVLACFRAVINVRLDCASGIEVVALCSPAVGNGPLNILLDPWPDWTALSAISPVAICGNSIELGGQVINYTGAPRWDPWPDWGIVSQAWGTVSLARLQRAAAVHASRSPLLAAVCGLSISPPVFAVGLGQLDLWWHSQEWSDLATAVETMAGRGEGLTPAGDDFLCGLVVGMWATQQSPQLSSRFIADRAAPLTTTLSAAFLRRAAAGQVNAAWLALLEGLCRPLSQSSLNHLVLGVAASGYSSGADMLAGFLWLDTATTNDRRRTRQCA